MSVAPANTERLSRIEWAGLGLALLMLALWQLGASPLFDVDEGAFSEATREMLAHGDWLHTTLNGEPRFDKPIGVYWLQAISVSVFGLSEFALRLPSALCSWGWALALAHFAVPRFGRAVGVSAAVVLATSLGVLLIGRAATADSLLNLLLALATLDGWRWLESQTKAPLRRAFAWIGLGLLVKGPVAVLVPVAAVLLWLATSLPWRQALGRVAQAVGDWRAWVWMLAIAVPWYAYALHRHGMAFVEGFLVKHNLARYSSPLEQHGGSAAYYLVVLPLLLLPWAPLLAPVLMRVRQQWADPLRRFLLGWGVFVVAFFSLSGTKLPHYVLYGATPFVLLMALELQRGGRVMRVAITVCLLLLLGLLCGSAASLDLWAPAVKHPMYQALLQGQHAPALLTWVASLALLAVLILMINSERLGGRHGWSLPVSAGAAAVLVAAVGLGMALPFWGEMVQGPVKHAAQFARSRSEPAVQWGLHQPSFAVYREQETPRRAPRDGELALVRLDQLGRLMAESGGHHTMLFSERGIGLLLWRSGPAVPATLSALGPQPLSPAR